MKPTTMTRPQAALELALWQAEADSVSSSVLYVWLRECGMPSEIAIRLKDLIDVTTRIGDKIVSLGRVIAIKLIEFIKQHPNLAVGMALGAVISSLIAAIPFLGPILAPIAIPLGITVGAIAGHRMDKAAVGKMNSEVGVIQLTQDVIEIAREFFKLFIETLLALSSEFKFGVL